MPRRILPGRPAPYTHPTTDMDTAAQHPIRSPMTRSVPYRVGVTSVVQRAQMVLDANGKIRHVSKEARRLLGYYSGQRLDTCFFQLIHRRHRTRVMWEMAEMAGRNRYQAQWLIQVKTGLGTWQWYRVQASNQLHQSASPGIVLTLMPCGAGTPS